MAPRDFDKASFQSHEFVATGSLEVSRRFRASLNLSSKARPSTIGDGYSSNAQTLASLVEAYSFNTSSAWLEFSYGAVQARGEFRSGGSFADKEFNDDPANPGRSVDFANLNEHSTSPDATLLYRIGTSTQLFFGIGSSEVRSGNSPRDISRQFAGFEFAANSITSGSFRITNNTEDFPGNRRDLEFTDWRVQLDWKPRRC